MTTKCMLMRTAQRTGLELTAALSTAMMFCIVAQAAPSAPSSAEKSLSKVCGVAVPTSIERATSFYLLPITAMGGDTKPLCRLWQEVNASDEKSITLWDGIAGAVLLHAVSQQSNIAPYRALIGKAIVGNPAHFNQHLKTVDLAFERVYVHVRDNALLSRDWTPVELADHLQSRAPDVASTLQKAYGRWDAGN